MSNWIKKSKRQLSTFPYSIMAAVLNVAVIDPGDNSAVEQNGGYEHHVHDDKCCQQISTENSCAEFVFV